VELNGYPGTLEHLFCFYERYKIFMELNLCFSMKALVSNTAKDNGNPGPDYKYGFVT
jgi:hypothetical protein